ncbi:MAG: hypothetical protein QW448_09375 [Thermofilaceae archaeon]
MSSVSLAQAVAEAWLRAWETAVSHIPLPRGLSDFTLSLVISLALVLIYRYNKRLCWAALLALAGAVLLSALIYYTAPL